MDDQLTGHLDQIAHPLVELPVLDDVGACHHELLEIVQLSA